MSRFLINLDLAKLESQKKRNRSSTMSTFPSKLYTMLTDAEKLDFESIVSWQPNGKCFMVHDPSEFVEKVMSSYFKQTKYKSFQRQLNIYGFQRIASGPFEGSYCHPLFIRGMEDKCKQLVRRTSNDNNAKQITALQLPAFQSFSSMSSSSSLSSDTSCDSDEDVSTTSDQLDKLSDSIDNILDESEDHLCSDRWGLRDEDPLSLEDMGFCFLDTTGDKCTRNDTRMSFLGKHFYFLDMSEEDFEIQ